MTWQQLEIRIRTEIQPSHRYILKYRGNDWRLIVSNTGNEIYIMTGTETDNAKQITYEMIKYAYKKIVKGEDFDSAYFQKRYLKEYKNST